MTNEPSTQRSQKIRLCDLDFTGNLRWDPDEPADPKLTEAMKNHGLMQPILVEPMNEAGKHRVVDGYRRTKSAFSLRWTHIDANLIETSRDETQRISKQLVINTVRENLKPSIVSKAIFHVMSEGDCTSTEAIETLGLSKGNGSKQKSLLNLCRDVLAKADSGELPKESAYLISRISSPSDQLAIAQQVVDEKLPRAKVEAMVAELLEQRGKVRRSMTRCVFPLEGKGSISIAAPALDLKMLISILESLLKKAKQECKRGLMLSTFEKLFADLNRTTK
jgi:ParB/RepB/Spo0J family partition protein